MQLLDLTLPSAAANLALDEALLETTADGNEWLRFWELGELAVVAGRASRLNDEIDVERCRREHVPIVRRCSGGLSVLGGPGCLMYSVVLSATERPFLQSIDAIHQVVLDQVCASFAGAGIAVTRSGVSDVAVNNKKFSGNSLRCTRDGALYHGTILYQFPLERIEQLLRMPHRQPDYRKGRAHRDFLTNVDLQPGEWKQAFAEQWNAGAGNGSYPVQRVKELVEHRYSTAAWNHRLP